MRRGRWGEGGGRIEEFLLGWGGSGKGRGGGIGILERGQRIWRGGERGVRVGVSGREEREANLIEPSMVGWRASGAIDPGCDKFEDAGEEVKSIFMVFETLESEVV